MIHEANRKKIEAHPFTQELRDWDKRKPILIPCDYIQLLSPGFNVEDLETIRGKGEHARPRTRKKRGADS